MDRLSDNFSKLELKQMKTIDKLQDKVKLLEFDVSNNGNIIRELKTKLKVRDKTLKLAIKRLEEIKESEKYEDIDIVIYGLRISMRRLDNIEGRTYYD